MAIMGGPTHTQFRCVEAQECLVLPEGVTSAEAASSQVNPFTVLGMLGTMRMENHSALVHTAAASNISQMLIRLCNEEGVELVNIVCKQEHVGLLKSIANRSRMKSI